MSQKQGRQQQTKKVKSTHPSAQGGGGADMQVGAPRFLGGRIPQKQLLGFLEPNARAQISGWQKWPKQRKGGDDDHYEQQAPTAQNIVKLFGRNVRQQMPQKIKSPLLKTEGLRFLVAHIFSENRERRLGFIRQLNTLFTGNDFRGAFPEIPHDPPYLQMSRRGLALALSFSGSRNPALKMVILVNVILDDNGEPERIFAEFQCSSVHPLPDSIPLVNQQLQRMAVHGNMTSSVRFTVHRFSVLRQFLVTILSNPKLIPYLNPIIVKKSTSIINTLSVPSNVRMSEQQLQIAMKSGAQRPFPQADQQAVAVLVDSFYGRASEVLGASFR